jgi:hypothetical protein
MLGIIFSFNLLIMAYNEIFHVTLNGDNYSLWSQAMCSFLKGRKIRFYVTNQRKAPNRQEKETYEAFAICLED